MIIIAADKIGNQCICGGAKVRIHVDHEDVEAVCTDNADGSYSFKWRSERSDTYSVSVTIDDVPVIESLDWRPLLVVALVDAPTP